MNLRMIEDVCYRTLLIYVGGDWWMWVDMGGDGNHTIPIYLQGTLESESGQNLVRALYLQCGSFQFRGPSFDVAVVGRGSQTYSRNFASETPASYRNVSVSALRLHGRRSREIAILAQ